MVLHHPLDSSPSTAEQTLAVLWHTQARRVDGRTIVQCVALGALGTIAPLVLGRGTLIALPSIIVAAFGSYAAIVQPSLGGRWLPAGVQRVAGIVVSTVAALAGVATALFVLGAIFGDSIEVMRR